MDIDEEKHSTVVGKRILDFNMAYYPWCAYSEDCAFQHIDLENWFEVPVYAGGENKYKEINPI